MNMKNQINNWAQMINENIEIDETLNSDKLRNDNKYAKQNNANRKKIRDRERNNIVTVKIPTFVETMLEKWLLQITGVEYGYFSLQREKDIVTCIINCDINSSEGKNIVSKIKRNFYLVFGEHVQILPFSKDISFNDTDILGRSIPDSEHRYQNNQMMYFKINFEQEGDYIEGPGTDEYYFK